MFILFIKPFYIILNEIITLIIVINYKENQVDQINFVL